MTREEKLQKAHRMFDNRNLLIELKWQRKYFKSGYVNSQEELFNLWIFDECIKTLEQEPKWIPVTERLPDEGYSVLVMRITDDNYKYMRVATYQGDCWMDDTDKFNNPNPHKVIAWMPLPQPYKAESEVNNG